MRRIIFFGSLFSLLWMACSKEDTDPLEPAHYSTTPEIRAVVKVDSIKQFGKIRFDIYYRDGDGNIGTVDPDDHSLEITDKRADIVHTFHVPPVSAIPNVIVDGVLTVVLENVVLLDQDNDVEKIPFEVSLKDTDGNWSKKYTTKTVTITK